MKKSELRKIIKEELQAVLHEKEEVYNIINKETGKLITDTPLKKSLALKLAAKKKDGKWIIQPVLHAMEEEVELSSDEQKIFDDIIGEGLTEAEVDFKDILSKVKRYARKGVLTATILAKLTGPTLGLNPEQVKDITQIANTEMQAETMKQIQKDVSYKDLVKMAKEENWDGAPGRTMMKSWMKGNKKTASFTIIRTVGSTESGAWQMATSVAKANKINPIKFQTSNVGKFVGELSNGNVVVAYVIPNASF